MAQIKPGWTSPTHRYFNGPCNYDLGENFKTTNQAPKHVMGPCWCFWAGPHHPRSPRKDPTSNQNCYIVDGSTINTHPPCSILRSHEKLDLVQHTGLYSHEYIPSLLAHKFAFEARHLLWIPSIRWSVRN